jgi:hypothetical protein
MTGNEKDDLSLQVIALNDLIGRFDCMQITDCVNHVQQNSDLKERRKDRIPNLYKYILFSLDKIRTHIFDTLQRQSRSRVYLYQPIQMIFIRYLGYQERVSFRKDDLSLQVIALNDLIGRFDCMQM